jgi:hypothetical protein
VDRLEEDLVSVVTLGPGTRLRSAVCGAEVVVVRPPSSPVELTCGGEPMLPLDGAPSPAGAPAGGGDGALLGKRYEDAETGLEVLCTKGGSGSLAVGDRPLVIKGAKPLPASD